MKESYFQITLANILHKLLSVIHSKKKKQEKDQQHHHHIFAISSSNKRGIFVRNLSFS